jgi:high-affinity iron transporter
MITGALIAFREFLEAFLIVGVFLGISKKLNLKREKEIILAASVGILFSFILSIITYFFGDSARHVLTEERADMLESYLLIFSGVFIAYVMLSLHTTINRGRGKVLLSAHSKLKANTFDLSLFLTIVFLVIREGFEIVLFTATNLFSCT